MLTNVHSSQERRDSNGARIRGVTLVEAAITLLLLFTFIFAIIEFALIFNEYHTITNAAREGARFAVAPCSFSENCGTFAAATAPTDADVEAKVRAYLSTTINSTDTGATVQVSTVQQPVPDDAAHPGNVLNESYRKVHVEAPYRFLFFPFGTITLRTDAVMRNENN